MTTAAMMPRAKLVGGPTMAILNSSFGLSGSVVGDETPPKMKSVMLATERPRRLATRSEISWRRTERKEASCERRRGPTFCLGPVIVGVDLAEEALAEPVDKEAEDGEPAPVDENIDAGDAANLYRTQDDSSWRCACFPFIA